MPSENPYKSPETTPSPQPSVGAADRIHTRFPTWRFWALSLFGAFIVITLWLLQFAGQAFEGDTKLELRIATPIAAVSWTVSCIAILITWRSPAGFNDSMPSVTGITALSLAIILLATLDFLAVAAFFIALFLPSVNQWDSGRAIAGLALGVFALFICARVARDLWLDAMGRPKKNSPGA